MSVQKFIPKDHGLTLVVDANNFYTSCEEIFAPSLRGKALASLSANDGNVIARSQACKDLGVTMSQPFHEIQPLVKAGKLIVCSGNFALYEEMSARFLWAVQQFIPTTVVEPYSVDEQFACLPAMPSDEVYDFGVALKQHILLLTGLPVSVGIGYSKTQSKAALEYSKHAVKDGVCVMQTPEEVDRVLEWLPIADVWGIGPKKAAWLMQHSIVNARLLRDADLAWIRHHLTVVTARTVLELRGKVAWPLVTERATQQEVMVARAFGQCIFRKEDVAQALQFYVARAAEKLRKQGLVAQRISVFVMTNPFRTNQKQYARHISLPLPRPTAYTPTLVATALAGLEVIYKPAPFHRVGVRLSQLAKEDPEQGVLFGPHYADERERIINRLIDSINNRYGRETIRFAGSGFKRPWATRHAMRSPGYLSKWSEIPKVLIQAR